MTNLKRFYYLPARLVAAFDKDPQKIGQQVVGTRTIKIQPLSDMPAAVKKLGIRLGVLAVPAPAAQAVAEEMVAAGIRGILNFAPVNLQITPEVSVASVDLGVHLEQLSFQLSATSV